MNTNKLNKIFEESGKSKVQLAKECGITRVTLDNALQGGDIRVSILESIAKALHINVGSLFGEPEPTKNATAVNNSIAANGNVHITDNSAVLKERVAMLEELLKEKERTIQILMEKK